MEAGGFGILNFIYTGGSLAGYGAWLPRIWFMRFQTAPVSEATILAVEGPSVTLPAGTVRHFVCVGLFLLSLAAGRKRAATMSGILLFVCLDVIEGKSFQRRAARLLPTRDRCPTCRSARV
jgi:hypothetical protein